MGRFGVKGALIGVLAGFVLVTACGGGGGGDDPPDNPSPPNDPTPGEIELTGVVTYDFVPAVAGSGGATRLAYEQTEARPVRGATVEAVEAGQVVASTRTDLAGAYALTLPANRNLFLRVRAELVETGGAPSWDVRVVDNTSSDAPYTLDGTVFGTGTADAARDLHAPSGWDASTSSYASDRAAAPFAILDTVREAMDLVLTADPSVDFPALDLHWSPGNLATGSPATGRDSGEIGTSFYGPGDGIYILGEEDADTDEYDRHVIAHEWGHYFENEFSRSDSIGGPHAYGDILDMRVAFGEGFGNAFSGMALNDRNYRDVVGNQQSEGFSFSLESGTFLFDNPPGWYSEQSVAEILWDLFDGVTPVTDASDNLEIGFGPIYAVFVGPYAGTTALTSVYAFVDALKELRVQDTAAIDQLTEGQDIAAVQDEYGTGEVNDAGAANPEDVIPVYHELTVAAGAVNVCSTDEFESEFSGGRNKLGARQYLRFDVPVAAAYTISMTTTSLPPDAAYSDPDFFVHRAGLVSGRCATGQDPLTCSTSAPTAACQGGDMSACVEAFRTQLAAGPHVLDVHEWTNTNAVDDEDPPIGRTCFDVEVTP